MRRGSALAQCSAYTACAPARSPSARSEGLRALVKRDLKSATRRRRAMLLAGLGARRRGFPGQVDDEPLGGDVDEALAVAELLQLPLEAVAEPRLLVDPELVRLLVFRRFLERVLEHLADAAHGDLAVLRLVQ